MENPFPLNAWYAVAWNHEVTARGVLARTVCNQNIALWRTPEGEIAALEDSCWHRRLPLSMGHVEGSNVVCRYHGLAFDAAGRCTRMPSQEKPSASARVRAFPAAERHRLVGGCPVEPDRAYPAVGRDLHPERESQWPVYG